MTKPTQILHLIDDTTPGGVMRMIAHLTSTPDHDSQARHEVHLVTPGSALPQCHADIVVSHLTINWRILPRLIAFRARHAGRPLVHVEHSYTEAFTALNVPARGRFFTLLRTCYALFERVVAVSEVQGRWLLSRGLVSPAALRIIPPAVDLKVFRALPVPRRPARVIGGIGRLHRQKGFDVLIAAFRALPCADLALHIHGQGPEEAALKALASGDPRIRFFGHASRPETALAAVDVVAMPSRWEAYGLVAQEARAAGRVLVCADVDGLRDSGAGGRFVKGHAPHLWTKALGAALQSAPAKPPLAPDHDTWDGVFAELAQHSMPKAA